MTRLNHWKLKLFPLLLALVLALSACQGALPGDWSYAGGGAVSLDDIPAYSGQAYIAVNDNLTLISEPHFCYCVSFVPGTAGFTDFLPLPRLAPARIYRLSYLLK